MLAKVDFHSGTKWTHGAAITLVLCALGALAEGIDLQSMGVAAAKLIPELHLSHVAFGSAASMSLFGLLLGAVIAGPLADRIGRKRVLVASLTALGVCSLLTAAAATFGQLLAVRLLVGLGLGGSFPILIALTSEAAPEARRATAVSLMYAGIPAGSAALAVMTLVLGKGFEWRWVFYVGGALPLALAPAILVWMPESARFRAGVRQIGTGKRPMLGTILFGGLRRRATPLLWIGNACTLLIIYLITNWLNQLMAGRGLSLAQSSVVLFCWGVGAMIGAVLLGMMTDGPFRRWSAVVVYTGLALSLLGLSQLHLYPMLMACGFGAGFFATGASLVSYALAPAYYPTLVRGTGLGWMVGVGRCGSISGPALGGLLLQGGIAESSVLLVLLIPLTVAGFAITAVLWGPAPPALD